MKNRERIKGDGKRKGGINEEQGKNKGDGKRKE